ncbi:MAG: hypothetical protein ACYDB7_11220 [Mycobacteriales bacterium]
MRKPTADAGWELDGGAAAGQPVGVVVVGIDLVCAEQDNSPTPVTAVGSIKWRARRP